MRNSTQSPTSVQAPVALHALRNKKILLALTGSVAAYKSVFLLRLLKSAGAQVQVLMSAGACHFIQPLTLAALSGMPVLRDFYDTKDGRWHNHVSVALWADILVIAPLSAHTLSKMTSGHCDNMLLATYLSVRCPVLLAPAMDADMYAHPTTTSNLQTVRRFGHHILAATTGPLASGLCGQGRMAEPAVIFAEISSLLAVHQRFMGTKVLITAGPTQESLDPVRFITNHSSGKMGIAVAEAFAHQGAEVDLVLGPCTTRTYHPRIVIHHVKTAVHMRDVACKLHAKAAICIFAAAVTDYRFKTTQPHKLKKEINNTLTLSLVQNPDIAQTLGKQKKPGQFYVGFALETENETENARKKLKDKHFDMLVLNSLQEQGACCYHDTNKVSFFFTDGVETDLPLKSKNAVAQDILDALYSKYKK